MILFLGISHRRNCCFHVSADVLVAEQDRIASAKRKIGGRFAYCGPSFIVWDDEILENGILE